MYLKKSLIILLVVSLLSLMSCDSAENKSDNNIGIDYNLINGEKDGALCCNYYIQDDCVTSSKKGWYEISLYDEVDLENICLDPTCNHTTGSSCTGRCIEHDKKSGNFCVTYNNKLIIFDYYQEVVNTDSESTFTWITDVYEAELDGSNRRCVLSFNGSHYGYSALNDNIMHDGKIYFAGEKTFISYYEFDENGMPIWKTESDHAIFCIDLDDYSVKEYLAEPGGLSFCNIYQFEDDIYIAKRRDPNYILYRIDCETDKVEKIFDVNQVIILNGIIDDKLFYQYQSSNVDTLYCREIGSDEETEFAENVYYAQVMYGKIYAMQTGWTDDYCKHIVYDVEGNIIETLEYDGYIYFCGNVGNNVVYYTMAKVGVIDIENIKDALSVGQDIGIPF